MINGQPPQNQHISIAQAMQLAEQHQAAGNLQQAEVLLRSILHTAPKHAGATHLLGIIAHQAGNVGLAVQLITQAISHQPDNAVFHANLCEMLRQSGQLDEALKHGQQAVVLDPGNASAHSNLGIVWYDRGELKNAERCQQKALSIHPSLIAALNNLGSINRDRKDLDAAEQYYRQALKIAPHYFESMSNLGAVLTEKEQPEEGLQLVRQALGINPDYADAHHNIALTWLVLEQEDKAAEHFNRELELRPQHHAPYQGLAQLHLIRRELDEANAMAEKALQLAPEKAALHALHGDILGQRGYPEQAEAAYHRALELEPELEAAFLGLGHLLMETGKMELAKDCFRHALSGNPDSIGAQLSLVQASKVKAGDPGMQALIEASQDMGSMLEQKAMGLHFALGKCHDDIGEYDQAFEHFSRGCQLQRKRIAYSTDANMQYVERIASLFSADNINKLRGNGCSSRLPVFVLGMPRSGTTLTEQIIASHSQAHGAGELPDLLNLANNPGGLPEQGSEFPQCMEGITQAELKILGQRYIDGLRSRNTSAARITDKMPANFFCLGLIHLMLPNAKIIHVRRNPVDTCLSNFTKLFAHKAQPQSYSLKEIGLYYRNYARLMDHWRSVLPAGSFYEISYEELVADYEPQARALLQYCGLEWEDTCMEFHKTERTIKTASITQVRQPIYQTSVERWRRYEKHLQPLIDALGALASEAG